MDYLCLVVDIIDFIENNLFINLNIETISKQFKISKFYIQRLFKAAADDTLVNYIRKRKLTESLADLKRGGMSVIDVAQKCNFHSQEAYTRTFNKLFNITPGKYKKSDIDIQGYKRKNLLKENIIAKSDGHLLDFKAVTLPVMNFIGNQSRADIEYFDDMVDVWSVLLKNIEQATFLKNKDIHYNIFQDGFPDDAFMFIAAIETVGITNNEYPLFRFTLPAQKYVEFHHKGKTENNETEGADEVIDLIFKTWLSLSGYELDSSNINFIGISNEKSINDKSEDTHMKFLIPVK